METGAGDADAVDAVDIPDSKRASGEYSWGTKRQGRILDPRDFDLTGISPEMVSLHLVGRCLKEGVRCGMA